MMYVTKNLSFKNHSYKVITTSLLLTLLMLMTTGFTSVKTSAIEKCLDIEPNEIQACLSKTSKHITLSSCYAQVDTIKSNFLKENLRDYCFYQISEFPTLNSCVAKANQFISAENHDAALFDCHNQFQNSISKTDCKKLVKLFRYPDKGRHLNQQCDTLEN